MFIRNAFIKLLTLSIVKKLSNSSVFGAKSTFLAYPMHARLNKGDFTKDCIKECQR